MTLPTRTCEPSVIVTGEKIEWTRTFKDYPASLWNLVYYFRGPGTGVNVTATADGDDFVMSLASGTSDDFSVAGKYRYQAWASLKTDATDKHVVADGFVTVKIGFVSAATSVETRSAAKICLDVIDAAISGQMTRSVQEYEISTPAGTRRVKRMSPADLLEARTYYAKIVSGEIARERAAQGKSVGTQYKMRMFDN